MDMTATQDQPDHELLAAWELYKTRRTAWRSDDSAVSEKDDTDLGDLVDAAQDRVLNEPARTPAGLALKLRILFALLAEEAEAEEAALFGGPVPRIVLTDHRYRHFWNVIEQAEQLAAA